MQVRLVRRGSREEGEAIVGGSAARRVALVGELSERAWALTGRPRPVYSRDSIPVAKVVRTRTGQRRDE